MVVAVAVIWAAMASGFLSAEGTAPKTGTITGTVCDIYTRQPLAGAQVVLIETGQVSAANLEGKFTFKEVPVGSYSLRFTVPGMQPQVRTDIIVMSQRTVTINADIQLISLVDESVTVNAGYFSQTADQPANVVNFSSEEIRRAPGSAGDVSRIIAGLPSIAQVSDQANSLVVRGGSTHENLFLVDNIQVPNINHFPSQGTAGGAISLINVDFIEDVEFLAGGFSAIYGDKLSSVMNLRLREGNRDRINGQMFLDFSGVGASFEGPLPGKRGDEARGSWMFCIRRSYLDLLTDILEAGAAVRYSDFQAKAVYDLSARSKLTFIGLVGIDKSKVTREVAIDVGESYFGDTRSREYTFGVNWFWLWSDRGYSDTSFSHTFTRFDNHYRNTARDTLHLDNLSEEENFQIRSVSYLNLGNRHQVRFGFEGQHNVVHYDYYAASYTDPLGRQVPAAQKQVDVGADQAALFVEYTLALLSPLSINLGLRADYFSYTQRTVVSPRGSLTLQLSDQTSITAAVGIFRQNLPLLLLYRHEENRKLQEPMAYQYSLGFNHLLGGSVRLLVDAYYKDYRNFPVDPQRPSLCLLDELFGFSLYGDTPLTDAGKARSYGIEIVLQKKLKEKFYGMLSFSWFRTQYRDLEGEWRNREFDNRYIFAVQGGFKPSRNWEFSIRWMIAGGRPYTPFDIEASEAANSGIYDQDQINALRMPAYHSLNLRLDRRFYLSGSNITAYLSVWNAYNHDNTASYYWNEIENKSDFSYQFGILPVIGIEYKF